MNALILVSAAVILACPTAIGQSLKVPDILHHIEGVWGWTGRDGIGAKHSCAGEPMRIWLEDSGRVYKSQQVTGGLVIESKVAVQPGTTTRTGLPFKSGSGAPFIAVARMVSSAIAFATGRLFR